jgi:hypothetical protein
MTNKKTVQVNQIWQDCNIRFRKVTPRLIKVISIKNNMATCRNIVTGKITEIRLDRFKPNSTGYKLWGVSVGNKLEGIYETKK